MEEKMMGRSEWKGGEERTRMLARGPYRNFVNVPSPALLHEKSPGNHLPETKYNSN